MANNTKLEVEDGDDLGCNTWNQCRRAERRGGRNGEGVRGSNGANVVVAVTEIVVVGDDDLTTEVAVTIMRQRNIMDTYNIMIYIDYNESNCGAVQWCLMLSLSLFVYPETRTMVEQGNWHRNEFQINVKNEKPGSMNHVGGHKSDTIPLKDRDLVVLVPSTHTSTHVVFLTCATVCVRVCVRHGWLLVRVWVGVMCENPFSLFSLRGKCRTGTM